MTACPVWPWLSPYNVCVTFAPLILGWPNRKPWWQQPFANRPGAMVRIAIGFYVDRKHKWSGSSKELAIKRNVVSEKTGKQNFWPTSGQIPKDWCKCFFTPFLLNLIEQCPWPQPIWTPPLCLCYRVQRSWKNITVHLFMQLKHHSVMYWSKTGFVLPETDAVVFFAAENNFRMLNNTNNT